MAMSNDNSADESVMKPIEDWRGSQCDERRFIELERVYNGVIVRTPNFQRTVIERDGNDCLVFEDMEKLCEWVLHWHKSTGLQK